ncbi:MAG: trehalose-phosphatase [Azospirillaceae bacterium]|nr:trehalose-phosphatase [Azospirillaceae bacterium]
MPRNDRPVLPEGRALLLDPGRYALFLDIDGTLLNIVPHPDDAKASPALMRTLIALRERLAGALALVSGRDLRDIDRLFKGGDFDCVGSHGLEWRTATAGHGTISSPTQALDGVADALCAAAAAMPGLMIERKRYSIALHYRAIPERQTETASLARAALALIGPGFHLQAGKAVIELVPATAGKGSAIQRLMAIAPYQGRLPVFVGDDLTDESGFETVNRLNGVTIHIGGNVATAAHHVLATPAALRHWLRQTITEPADPALG